MAEGTSRGLSATLGPFRKESYGTENADGGNPLDCHYEEYKKHENININPTDFRQSQEKSKLLTATLKRLTVFPK